ncbi:MAG TPA: hypothetical protein PKB14_25480 [Rubrivivax sp.]|nr:hypothetical protein [Rubrivivax sp.]
MTDEELQALAAAFAGQIEEQALRHRAEMAALRRGINGDIDRLMKKLGEAVGDALLPAFDELRRRTAALESRSAALEARDAMPVLETRTAPEATQ